MKHDYKTGIWLWAAGSLVVIWLAILFAGSYEEGYNLIEIMDSLTLALQTPFSMKWSQNTLKIIGAFLFAYAMSIGFYYAIKKTAALGRNMAPLNGGISEVL